MPRQTASTADYAELLRQNNRMKATLEMVEKRFDTLSSYITEQNTPFDKDVHSELRDIKLLLKYVGD